jgi:p21-activated kinase 1
MTAPQRVFFFCYRGFGTVYSAKFNYTGEAAAVKKIKLPKKKNALNPRLITEIEHLKACRHPNITSFIVSHVHRNQLFIVMELVTGATLHSVNDMVEKHDDGFIAAVARSCLSAISCIHSKGLIHQDIKSENILVSVEGEIKVTDFGLSSKITDSVRDPHAGTVDYHAPEMLAPVPAFCEKVDIWAMGIVVVEMVNGSPPYSSAPVDQVRQLILANPTPVLSEPVTDLLGSFIHSLCTVDQEVRPSAATALEDPFLQGAADNHGVAAYVAGLKAKSKKK